MSVRVRWFAAAAEAAGCAEGDYPGTTVAEVLDAAAARHGERLAAVAARCAVLVEGRRADGSTPVPQGTVVDVLPPFAGG
ncbi:MoaD/ThiS family protein [Kytococcus sedentarius]|uniref:MoaD/ThiS family protein n=1 Tax=Kytococcus sedentarius TaxID=1276 RepID=UPI0035BC4DC9